MIQVVIAFVVGLIAGGFALTWWNGHKADLASKVSEKVQDLGK